MSPAEPPRAAMILAAGRGERLRPLTDTLPKPLLEVHGEPLIVRHVRALARAGITDITINLAWLGAKIRERLGDGRQHGVTLRYSEESPRALETGGGIFRALPGLRPGPFAVVNGDIYCDYPFGNLAIPAVADAHVVLVPNPPHHPHGDFGLQDGLALAAAPRFYTFAGIGVYRVGFFDGCIDGAFPLRPLLLRCMAAGRCSAELHVGKWEDVGTSERLAALNAEPGGTMSP